MYTFIEVISIADSIRETERTKPDLRDRFMVASDWWMTWTKPMAKALSATTKATNGLDWGPNELTESLLAKSDVPYN